MGGAFIGFAAFPGELGAAVGFLHLFRGRTQRNNHTCSNSYIAAAINYPWFDMAIRLAGGISA